MKTILLFVSLLFLSKSIYAQNAPITSVNDLIKSIRNESNTRSQKVTRALVIDEKFIKHTFLEYDLLIQDSENYRIVAHENDYDLMIISKKGKLKGRIIDEVNNIGYLLSYTNKLILTPKSKDEIIFVCKNNATSSLLKPQNLTKETIPEFENSTQTTNSLALESRPNATNLIYLDFDGEAILTGWEKHHYVAKNGNVPNEIKVKIWESIAEDFIQFDVNITTNRTLFEKHSELNRQMLVVAEFGAPGWRGVAFMESFGSGSPALMDVPASYYDKDYTYLYRTGSHEIGHTLGLAHDGGTTGEYYSGLHY